jgi:hypothetical protein
MAVIKFKNATLINRADGTFCAKLYGVANENAMPYIFTNPLVSIHLEAGKLDAMDDGVNTYFRED